MKLGQKPPTPERNVEVVIAEAPVPQNGQLEMQGISGPRVFAKGQRVRLTRDQGMRLDAGHEGTVITPLHVRDRDTNQFFALVVFDNYGTKSVDVNHIEETR